jgi:hypothetical protein
MSQLLTSICFYKSIDAFKKTSTMSQDLYLFSNLFARPVDIECRVSVGITEACTTKKCIPIAELSIRLNT